MSHEATDMLLWSGRACSGKDETLIHDVVHPLLFDNLEYANQKSIAFLGFCSDEGVKRNMGRPGAIDGPNAIRKALCNLAVHWNEIDLKIHDAGNVLCLDQDLESAQGILEEYCRALRSKNYFPLLLGGGHEISYPHFKGIDNKRQTTGMINLDAHFDLRTYENGAHSGSWARQIMDDKKNEFNYLPIGINPSVNNRQMFGLMKHVEQDVILVEELKSGLSESVITRITSFIDRCDQICLTLDLDVISGAHAPGVSAPAAFGISPELTWDLIELIFDSNKVRSMDIAELNPAADDGRTARLVGQIVQRLFNLLSRK